MPEKETPDWLPEGWTATAKRRRDGRRSDWTYIHSSTGSRLYSKAAVFRYLESGLHTPSPNKEPNKEGRIIVYSGADTSSSQRQSVDNKFNNNTGYSSSPLPDGWIKEFKPRKSGSKVKKEFKPRKSGSKVKKESTGYSSSPLPDGWIKEFELRKAGSKVIKETYYVDPESGYKFRSRKDALRYIAAGNVNACIVKPKKADNSNKYSIENVGSIVKQPDGQVTREEEPDGQVTRKESSSGAIKRKPTIEVGGPRDSPKWLPSGWITEIRTQQTGRCAGQKTKCFFDPFTETRFHSKRKVLEYLESEEIHSPLAIKETSMEMKPAGDICSPLTNEETSIGTKSACDIFSPLTNEETSMGTKSAGDICTSGNQIGSADNKFTSNTSSSSYELPDGWIKEVRLRKWKGGVKKDPYFIDPVSGYEFRSRRDAWRYIESGDVRRCINRPMKRHKSDTYSTGNKDQGEELVVIRKSNNSSSRVRRKGQSHKKMRAKKQADSQKQGSTPRLPPRTKPFKTPPPPTRSSQRLAAALKAKQAVESGISNAPEGSKPMAIVPLDFFRKPEVEGPPVVEETKASGDDRIDDIQNQESAAQLCPGETKSFEAITQPDRSLEQPALTEADHVVDTRISDSPFQTMPSMPEVLPMTPEPGTVQSSEKADDQKAAPTVNQDEQAGTLQSSVKAAEEQMTLPQGTVPVTPAPSESSEKAEEPETVEKLEVQEQPQTVEAAKVEVQEQAQTVETKPSFDTPDSPLIFPFGDSWSDPCLEFAFKTLTGDIPLEDTASIENYFQQQAIQSQPKPCVRQPVEEGSSDAEANGLRLISKANVE